METKSNEQKARELAKKICWDSWGVAEKTSYEECYDAAMEMAAWKEEQLADYLQREWDRCSGACSTIVSVHCREVERMANDLGVRLKFNNPYID